MAILRFLRGNPSRIIKKRKDQLYAFTVKKKHKGNDNFFASSIGHLKALKCPDLETELEIHQKTM